LQQLEPIAPQAITTVLQNGVYTACEPCKDDPRKPPLWQVKAREDALFR